MGEQNISTQVDEESLRNFMKALLDDVVALDSAILQHPRVWEASGHLAGFSDPMVDCRTCKARFRADHLAEKAPDLVCPKRPSKLAGEGPDCDLTAARDFNLMFKTTVGPVEETGSVAYLRPETAQGIFINFKNVLQFSRKKPPFGIAQIGKSFRNEVNPRNFIFRSREFEQMEMEFFCPPEASREWYEFWVAERMRFWLELGVKKESLRIRHHDAEELAFYSTATADIEYAYPFTAPDFGELEGVAHRGDYDLTQHQNHSKTKLEYFDQPTNERYVPHVIEPAAGADRATLAFLADAYDEDEVGGEKRTVLKLHPRLSPVKVAVFPLMRKDGHPELARELFTELRGTLMAEYDDGGAIGKRYRRQDEVGTPYCITVDGQSTTDQTVTVRDRDTLAQDRVDASQLKGYLAAKLAG